MEPEPDLSRYQRQSLLPGFGPEAQRQLSQAHAVIVGVGALGCTSADLLARAGVGRITLIDRDVVDKSNLQRQTLYTEADAAAGTPKAIAAAERLRAVNSEIRVHAEVADVIPSNTEELVLDGELADDDEAPHAVLDGTDNFETRFIINDLSVKEHLAYFYAGAVGGLAMSAPFLRDREDAPCLRCLIAPPEPGSQPTCDTAGVLGPSVVTAAARQAADAIRYLAGLGDSIRPVLFRQDLLTGEHHEIDLAAAKDPACPCCGLENFEYLNAPDPKTVSLCGRDAVQIHTRTTTPPDLALLAARLGAIPDVSVQHNELLLKAALPGHAITVFADGRAIVHGTTDPDQARAIHARYISS
ncbi:MAG: molybdopterin/thiamine biosynthesis adenylyltransferase [Phycisphaerales bacterium]